MEKHIVKVEEELLPFLRKELPHKSKNNIKTLLSKGLILVDNQTITKYNYPLKKGQVITIKKTIDNHHNISLDIIYEDNNIIVINKPTNLLTISTDKEKERTLYREVSNYLKPKKQKVFIIHRLDKDTSGVIMFAKNQTIQQKYQKDWNKTAITREYIAIVEGITKKKEHLVSYLKQNRNLEVYLSQNKEGLIAITDYEQIKHKNQYSLLKILISTGRRNQIRLQLKSINHPIIGDKKYQAKTNPINRLGLHDHLLKVKDPITGKILTFEAPIPDEFTKLFK